MKNICIVGCGKMGNHHAKNLFGLSNLYFHSQSKKNAISLCKKFHGKQIFNQFDDIIQNPYIDAVVISSPPGYHKEQIIQSLQAGKSVLVEKPMCISEIELLEIEKALNNVQRNAFLMVAENYYYKPSLKKIKFLKDHFIGNIQSVVVNKLLQQPVNGWKMKFGALLEGGIHYIALISDLFDDWPVKIDAYFPFSGKGEVERHSIIELAYKHNATATLTYSWTTKSLTKGVFQNSYLIGDKGVIIFESNGLYVFLRSDQKMGFYIPNLLDLMGYHALIKDFLNCLDDKKRRPYSDYYKAARDLSIVFQAYKSLRF